MREQTGRVSSHNTRAAHLLLVDDDPALLDALSETLRIRLGHFTLDTCETGRKALECVTAKHYDTIISDVNMPGLNGLDLLLRLKQIRAHTPVVMISGYADTALISRAIDAGASDFIAKPIDRDVFLWTVRLTLHLSRLRWLSECRQAMIGRARDHYIGLIEKLGHDRGQSSLTTLPKGDSRGYLSDSRIRQDKAQQQVNDFQKRSARHLSNLNAFLSKAGSIHRQILKEAAMAEAELRRLALRRLQDRYYGIEY